MGDHIAMQHPGHVDASTLSPKFLQLITIDNTEELVMGIPQEQIPTAHTMVNSNPSMPQNSQHSLKRRAFDELPPPKKAKAARSTA